MMLMNNSGKPIIQTNAYSKDIVIDVNIVLWNLDYCLSKNNTIRYCVMGVVLTVHSKI